MTIRFMPCICVPGMECNVNGRCPTKDRERERHPDEPKKKPETTDAARADCMKTVRS